MLYVNLFICSSFDEVFAFVFKVGLAPIKPVKLYPRSNLQLLSEIYVGA